MAFETEVKINHFQYQPTLNLNRFLREYGVTILSSLTPEAPPGSTNIIWQTDNKGNISAYAPGGGGSNFTPFSEVPAGVIDGTNRVFTLSVTPVQAYIWLNFPLIPNQGYTLSGNTITFAIAPQPASGGVAADLIYAQGLY